MKIGRMIGPAIATHAALTVSVHGWDADGNFVIGANKLKTTTHYIHEVDVATVGIRKIADDDYMRLRVGTLDFDDSIEAFSNGAFLAARNVNANYVILKARDSGVGLVEIARLVGAADPYFQMTLPMVLAPAGIPGALVEGHLAYVAADKKLAFYDGTAALFLATNPRGLFTTLTFWDDTVTGGTTFYMQPNERSGSGTEGLKSQIISPVAGKLKDLYVALDAAPGAGNSLVVTVRINGVDTTITCTISDTDTTGSDIAHEEALAVGDLVSIKRVASDPITTAEAIASVGIG